MPTCEEIKEAVREYNSEYSKVDDALKLALQSLPTSSGRFLAEVCLIADWESIQQFTFRDRQLIA